MMNVYLCDISRFSVLSFLLGPTEMVTVDTLILGFLNIARGNK
jgi:hypothetical protein